MPWKTRSSVSAVRADFLVEHERGASIEELCERYEVSRSTGYALIAKARCEGVEAAVAERSRAPQRSPHALTSSTIEALLCLRGQFGYGPGKLAFLYEENFGVAISKGAVANVLAKYGEVRAWRRRRGRGRPTATLTEPVHPNDVWATDHKGPMGKQRLEPLNVIDHVSRSWLVCRPFTDKSYVDTRAAFEAVFDDNGTPLVMRVDAGTPWAAVSPHRLTKLSAWWLSLGIRTEVVPRCQDNGIVERLHGTMEREMSLDGVVDVREHFETKRQDYNHVRPHESLNMARPAEVYVRSPRRPVERVPDYSDCDEVKVVNNRGYIRWRGTIHYVSEALEGQTVGLRRLDLVNWSIRFHDVVMGVARLS